MFFLYYQSRNHVVDGETGAAYKVGFLLFIHFIDFQQTHYPIAIKYNRSSYFANLLQSLCKYFENHLKSV